MTRTYAAKRLLEHGPLSLAEFAEITGWPKKTAAKTSEILTAQGLVKRQSRAGYRWFVYGLAA